MINIKQQGINKERCEGVNYQQMIRNLYME